MEFLKSFFLRFHQTTPPIPIRGSLEPFLFLTIYHKAVQILKWLPSVPDTRDSKISRVTDTGESQLASKESPVSGTLGSHKSAIPGVRDTGESFFYCSLFFFQTSSYCHSLSSNNQSQNRVNLLFIIQIHLVHVKENFLTSLFLIDFPVSRTPGSCFKTLLWLL